MKERMIRDETMKTNKLNSEKNYIRQLGNQQKTAARLDKHHQ
jgi:hypothetical protein